MAIVVKCPNGHELHVKDELEGKKIRCNQCQAVVLVQSALAEDEWLTESAEEAEAPDEAPVAKRSSSSSKRKAQASGGNSTTLLMVGGGGGLVVVAFVAFMVMNSFAKGPESKPVENTPVVASTSTNSPATDTPVSKPAEPAKPAATAVAAAPEKKPEPSEAKPATVAPVAVAANTPKPQVSPETAKPPAANEIPGAGGVHVWDTAKSAAPTAGTLPTGGSAGLIAVAEGAAKEHKFEGDCLIENEKIRLYVPRDAASPVVLAAKTADKGMSVPISISGAKGKLSGAQTISVSELTNDSVVITYGQGGNSADKSPQVAFRVSGAKAWVEVKPLANAAELEMGAKSQFVIVPSEFGEDSICDANLFEPGKSLPIPAGNLVVSLECNGNFMSVLTFPTNDQAGKVSIGSGEGIQNHDKPLKASVQSASAKFNDKSVFVGIVPQKDSWYYEGVEKKYSAAGQYVIPWKPPYPGVWKLVGRVRGKYFISDAPDDHFVYSCSLSGTLDCLFGYLDAPRGEANGLVTPMTIYRETLGDTPELAYLLKSEAVDDAALLRRKTRYRDVCNSIDDMKNVWRTDPAKLQSDPKYVPNLIEDEKWIMQRMDRRLTEYEGLKKHAEKLVAELQKSADKDSPAGKACVTAIKKPLVRLTGTKEVTTKKSDESYAAIEEKLAAQNAKLNPTELDRLAERVRDVANHQEETLKKLRNITLELASACTQQRGTAPESMQPQITELGRHCRKVLRTRDTEE